MSTRMMQATAAGLAALLVAAGFWWWQARDAEPLVITADFGDTTGLYVGNDVEYLGVPVGTVVAIEPRGTVMRVRMEVAADTTVPRDASAMILQSSLVTDRYVEVGPAWTQGPTLTNGSHIPADRTRSPAGVDEITRSIDDLVRALDQTTPGGHDLGDLLRTTARTWAGNGDLLRETLGKGEQALGQVNAHGDELTALAADLATLVDALADRDTAIRQFADDVDRTSAVVAEQRHGISGTLASLEELTRVVSRFVRHNKDVIGDDLTGALRVARQLRDHQASLAEAFDTMPTLAENLARAYDWKQQRLRVQFNTETGPFSAAFRAHMCQAFAGPLCPALFAVDGSGLLDPLLDGLHDVLPGDLP